MPYDLERSCVDVTPDAVFQDIDRILGINIHADGRNPLNHLDMIIPMATPMAPVHSGSDHTLGLWLPIRRTRIAVVATSVDVNTFEVDDAEPFVVGDTVQCIDVTGPVTGEVTDLGAITGIDYDNDLLTVTNDASGLTVDDWIEVTENGSAAAADWHRGLNVGLLRNSYDMKIVPNDAVGMLTPAAVVQHGAIREKDINFNALATNDQILVWQLSQWQPGGGIQVITSRSHGEEIVALPDAP